MALIIFPGLQFFLLVGFQVLEAEDFGYWDSAWLGAGTVPTFVGPLRASVLCAVTNELQFSEDQWRLFVDAVFLSRASRPLRMSKEG